MKAKELLVPVIAVLALVLGFVGVTQQDRVETVVEKTVGAFPGPEIFSDIFVKGVFEQGGGKNTIVQQSASHTLTRAQMEKYNVITFTASTTQAALTVTLPASTTIPVSKEVGSTRSWMIENPFTAAATTTTIAAGTGIDLQEPDGQNVVIGINNYAWLTCVRGLDSGAPQDVVCKVDETIPAD